MRRNGQRHLGDGMRKKNSPRRKRIQIRGIRKMGGWRGWPCRFATCRIARLSNMRIATQVVGASGIESDQQDIGIGRSNLRRDFPLTSAAAGKRNDRERADNSTTARPDMEVKRLAVCPHWHNSAPSGRAPSQSTFYPRPSLGKGKGVRGWRRTFSLVAEKFTTEVTESYSPISCSYLCVLRGEIFFAPQREFKRL